MQIIVPFPAKTVLKGLTNLDCVYFKHLGATAMRFDIEEILVKGFFFKFLDLAHDSGHKLARKRTRPLFSLYRPIKFVE